MYDIPQEASGWQQQSLVKPWSKGMQDALRAFLMKKNGISIDLVLLMHTYQNSIKKGLLREDS